MSDSLSVPEQPMVIDLREQPDHRAAEHRNDALVFTGSGWQWKSQATAAQSAGVSAGSAEHSGKISASEIFGED